MNMRPDELDEIGRWADRLDNAAATTLLPISPILAVDGMKGVIEDVSAQIKEFVRARGEDPWEFQP